MAGDDVYASINEVLAIAWIYRIYLNADWLWTLVTLACTKYGLKSDAICLAGTRIRYGDLSAAYGGSCNMVEDVGNAIDLVRAVTNKCENRQKAAISLIIDTKIPSY